MLNHQINLPESRDSESDELIDVAQYWSYSNPREEVRQGSLRPDVIVEAEFGTLSLEVFVTHRVGSRRLQKIQYANRPTVEIRLNAGAVLSRKEIERAVLHEVENKRWIHPRAYTPKPKAKPLYAPIQDTPVNMLPDRAICRVCREEKKWSSFFCSTGEGLCHDCLPAYNRLKMAEWGRPRN